MKIGSRIKPRDGKSRTHTIGERRYVFARHEDSRGDIHYVADVHHPDHAATFMGNEGFYAYTDAAEAPALKRSGDQKPPVLPPAAASETFSAEQLDEGTKLVSGSVSEIGVAVGKVKSLTVIRAAIAVEGAKQQPRKGALDLLNAALEGAAQSGKLDP